MTLCKNEQFFFVAVSTTLKLSGETKSDVPSRQLTLNSFCLPIQCKFKIIYCIFSLKPRKNARMFSLNSKIRRSYKKKRVYSGIRESSLSDGFLHLGFGWEGVSALGRGDLGMSDPSQWQSAIDIHPIFAPTDIRTANNKTENCLFSCDC